MKNYTIEDLKNGDVIAEYEDNLEQLNELFKLATPKDFEIKSPSQYYEVRGGAWWGVNCPTNTPTQKVSDFLAPEKELISMDKKYRTRGGKEVEILTTKANGTHPVIANVEGIERHLTFTDEGKYYLNLGEDENDLIEVKEPEYFDFDAATISNCPLITGKMAASRGFRNKELIVPPFYKVELVEEDGYERIRLIKKQ